MSIEIKKDPDAFDKNDEIISIFNDVFTNKTISSKNVLKILSIYLSDNINQNNVDYYFKSLVDFHCLQIIVSRWKGWSELLSNADSIGTDKCKQFDEYMLANLEFLKAHKENSIKGVIDEYKNKSENVLYVFSSYRELKTFFHYQPHLYNNYFSVDSSKSIDYSLFATFSDKYILNYPYIKLKISFPNLEITRQIMTFNQFQLIDLTSELDFKWIKPQNTDLHIRYSQFEQNKKKIVNLKTMNQYLHQLKAHIKNEVDMPKHIINNLCLILNELQRDLALCKDFIVLGSDYLKYYIKYPYARLLGKPHLKNKPSLFLQHQRLIAKNNANELNYNIRLQETSYPCLYFVVNNFSHEFPFYGAGKFNFPKDYLNCMRYDGITYECTLCEKSGLINEIRAHLVIFHGLEPDWICVYCKNSFSTKVLSVNRWYHLCKP